MNIGINAIGFSPGKMGGVETYIRNLWQHLQPIDSANSYTLYCANKCQDLFPTTNPNFGYFPFDYTVGTFKWLMRGVLRRTTGFDTLKPVLNKIDDDLIHHPFTVLNPRGLDIPSVLTFWDMQQEFYPEFFTKNELKFRRLAYAPSVQQATRVIVSAEFTKQCLVEKYDIEAQKIDVVYTGHGSEYKVLENEDKLGNIRTRYSLNAPFLYYPAATWPHKNHKKLLHALKLLLERYHFDGQLVLTGISMQTQGEILRLIDELGLAKVVKVLGYLSYEDLPALYNLATLMVFPSLFEGFGIPLVEAMACGCPVVCSDVTTMPEVVGNSGAMFDPNSVEEMAGNNLVGLERPR